MTLTILTRFGDRGASSRMRAFQYLPYLRDAGIDVQLVPLFSNEDLGRRYEHGSYGLPCLIRRYRSRIQSVISNHSDLLWIEKELLPWMPAWLEKRIVGKRKYMMDFDDAVFHNYDKHRISLVRYALGRKIDALMRNADVVMAGNEYLAARARTSGCQDVEIIPTVIDLNKYRISGSQKRTGNRTIIGWIGSPYTTKYLDLLRTPLQRLAQQREIEFRIIGGRPTTIEGVPVVNLDWEEAREAEMLSEFDIGVMPLPDSHFEQGKCGYKLIQYMACQKPVIGSPVGVNCDIVKPENGLLCSTEQEWFDALIRLVDEPEMRVEMGLAGRQLVEKEYCSQQVAPRIIEIIRRLAPTQNGPGDQPEKSSTANLQSQENWNELEV